MKRKSFLFLAILSLGTPLPVMADPRGILELEGYSNAAATGITSKRGRNDFTIKERVTSGDELFFIKTYGYNGSAFGSTPAASISFQAAESWNTTSNGTSIVFSVTPRGETTPQSFFSINGGSDGYDMMTTTITINSETAGAVETAAIRESVVYNGTNGAELPSGRWLDFYYNQSGAVTTAHGIGFFSRLHGNIDNQGFMSAIEGNTLCTSTYTTAACVGVIAHTKHDSEASGAANAPIIGVNSRIDVTSDGFETTPEANGQVIHFRPDPGSIGGLPGLRFSMYTTDTDLQIVNGGNIIKLPGATQVITEGATIDISKACGGQLRISSVGAVTTNTTNTFTDPSASATDGTFNDGCLVNIVNVDSADAITLDANAKFITFDGNNVALGAGGGSVFVGSYDAGNTWYQATLKTK